MVRKVYEIAVALETAFRLALERQIEKTSGRCHWGPARHSGKCFCPPLSSSSGSWSLYEQCRSVLINFWPPPPPPFPIMHPSSLCLSVSLLLHPLFTDLFPQGVLMEDGGFTGMTFDILLTFAPLNVKDKCLTFNSTALLSLTTLTFPSSSRIWSQRH